MFCFVLSTGSTCNYFDRYWLLTSTEISLLIKYLCHLRCRPPPTFWEAAADAILLKKLRPFRNPLESDLETEVGSEKDEADTDHDPFEKHQQHHNKLEERFVNVPRLMENGNDIVSVKSGDTILDDD